MTETEEVMDAARRRPRRRWFSGGRVDLRRPSGAWVRIGWVCRHRQGWQWVADLPSSVTPPTWGFSATREDATFALLARAA